VPAVQPFDQPSSAALLAEPATPAEPAGDLPEDLLLTTGVGWLLGEARYKLKQRTEEKYHWLIDPIVTGLAHIGIRLTRESGGEVVSWRWTVDS